MCDAGNGVPVGPPVSAISRLVRRGLVHAGQDTDLRRGRNEVVPLVGEVPVRRKSRGRGVAAVLRDDRAALHGSVVVEVRPAQHVFVPRQVALRADDVVDPDEGCCTEALEQYLGLLALLEDPESGMTPSVVMLSRPLALIRIGRCLERLGRRTEAITALSRPARSP